MDASAIACGFSARIHYFELDELAHQRWQGDRIAEERFYFDPAQMAGRTRSPT